MRASSAEQRQPVQDINPAFGAAFTSVPKAEPRHLEKRRAAAARAASRPDSALS